MSIAVSLLVSGVTLIKNKSLHEGARTHTERDVEREANTER
jgi:hypothetical protein